MGKNCTNQLSFGAGCTILCIKVVILNLFYFFLKIVEPILKNSGLNKCDMIKGNESDVKNIDFELQAKRGDIHMFYIVFEVKELFISPEPDV